MLADPLDDEDKKNFKRMKRRRSSRYRWNRKKGEDRKRRQAQKVRKNTLQKLKKEDSLESSIDQKLNLDSLKKENVLQENESETKQILRVRPLAELEDKSKANPDGDKKLVRLIKSRMPFKEGGKVIFTSSSGKRILASRHPQFPGQQPNVIVIKELNSTSPQIRKQPIATSNPKTAAESRKSAMQKITLNHPTRSEMLITQPDPTEEEVFTPTEFVKLEMACTATYSDSEDDFTPELEIHTCAHCQITFATQSDLIAHLDRLKHLCECCQEVLPSVPSLKIHLKEAHGLKGYKCPNCNFYGTSMWDLKLHQSRDHCQDFMHACEECDKPFKNSEELQLHTSQVHSPSIFLCEVCGKEFKNVSTLKRHIESIHQNMKYPCKQCDKIFDTNAILSRHMYVHSAKEKIVCEQCGKKFDRQSDHKLHMRRHTGEKPHICTICSKAFAKRTTLRQHLLIHSGRRPYVCDICGKSFTQKPGLTAHRKSHPGDLPPMPSLFIDEILKDLPEDAFKNLGPKNEINVATNEESGDEDTPKEKETVEEETLEEDTVKEKETEKQDADKEKETQKEDAAKEKETEEEDAAKEKETDEENEDRKDEKKKEKRKKREDKNKMERKKPKITK